MLQIISSHNIISHVAPIDPVNANLFNLVNRAPAFIFNPFGHVGFIANIVKRGVRTISIGKASLL